MTLRNYLYNVLNAMARGLFATLIMGTIIRQIGIIFGFVALEQLGQAAMFLMGPAIGSAIAIGRGAKPFTILSAMVAGAIGAGTIVSTGVGFMIITGEPVGALLSAVVAVEVGRLVEGRSKFDLLVVPAAVIISGGLVGITIAPYIAAAMTALGAFINNLTMLQPLLMGVLIAVFVGMMLTGPTSSVALCVAIGIDGLAAGAALAGCAAQMVGFAVISFRENKFSGLISQGLGTSMIQFPNIIKNPLIWLPPTIAGAICGGLSTMVFGMRTTSVGAGMGTSGLVGQFTTLTVMGEDALVPIALLHFIIPAVISLVIAEFMRSKNLIRHGDMQL
ncbi:MAG: PTS sugar transporter subunit IIC, partial [Defluviitaleaceae bacterium]|nr:PTS sugar transporter subunit IIC [Defluviitaleaceae bacterium]